MAGKNTEPMTEDDVRRIVREEIAAREAEIEAAHDALDDQELRYREWCAQRRPAQGARPEDFIIDDVAAHPDLYDGEELRAVVRAERGAS